MKAKWVGTVVVAVMLAIPLAVFGAGGPARIVLPGVQKAGATGPTLVSAKLCQPSDCMALTADGTGVGTHTRYGAVTVFQVWDSVTIRDPANVFYVWTRPDNSTFTQAATTAATASGLVAVGMDTTISRSGNWRVKTVIDGATVSDFPFTLTSAP